MNKAERFLAACRRQPVDCTPVWMMRQAGRYLPEYRALRARHGFLEMCRTPELAVEVTLQPMRRFELDAAIVFADILLPLPAMGLDLVFEKGDGPAIRNPVRTAADVDRLRPVDPTQAIPYVLEALRTVRRELDGKAALIGFAGAPFTLASYIIEGGASRHYEHTKAMMVADPAAWHRLAEKLADVCADVLGAQIAAGAQAVQLFDSWVGCLSKTDYAEFVRPHVEHIFARLDPSAAHIHFANGASHMLAEVRAAGGDVIAVDWRLGLDEAWQAVGHDRAVQGNLDPVLLLAPQERLGERIADVLRRAGSRDGHVFNLGHGVLPTTSPENVGFAVEHVHALSRRNPPAGAGGAT
ncbi:MAG: uroporphyrinogen decarboxylase [Deltaproteobacteria bacterium]|nr:uroporphyrinogen decarboxylase [Deltaproteobacteria bacterium]